MPPNPSGPPLGPIESLVGPVALYPDPLLSELLIAATYPVEIVQAARWLEANPDLGTLKDKDWDPSVQRIAQVPEVLKMMNQHLDWTTALGNAFLENPDAVLSAVQMLRGKAVATGFLKDTPQQKVEKKVVKLPARPAEPAAGAAGGAPTVQATPAVLTREVVAIQPAKPDTLYVPQYSPEVAYSAPLAPPPGGAAPAPAATTAAYPAQPAYYPGYAPTTTSTQTSTTNPWLSFGAGALVGGLVTWGIMELADGDDWDDGYWGDYYGGPVRVVHHYGDAVCYRGNCWNGGGYRGNGYRGDVNIDRGDINLNREVNVSGNRVAGDRTFKLDDLKRSDQVWRHDPEHRRGQRYTEQARERIAERRQPDRAGSRLSGLDGLREGDRGIGDGPRREDAGRPSTLPAKRPISSDEVRARLSGKRREGAPGGARDKLGQRGKESGLAAGARERAGDKAAGKLSDVRQDGAFSGAKERGSQVRQEARRGQESRQIAGGSRQIKERVATGGGSGERLRQRAPERSGALAEHREAAQRPVARPNQQRRVQASGGDRQQRIEQIRRADNPKPSAFGGARDGNRARDFGQRGAASRQKVQAHQASRPGGGLQRPAGAGLGQAGGGRARGGGGGGRLRGR